MSGIELPELPEGVTHEIQVITPEIAEKYLALNTENRPLRAPYAMSLAKSMSDGQWTFTPDPICFRKNDGILMNGQHRLHAIVTSGRPQAMFVVWGLSEDAWARMDRGAKRTSGDEFARRGFANGPHTAAATRLLWRYAHDDWSGSLTIPDDQLIAFYEQNPDLMETHGLARRLNQDAPLSPAVGTVALYLSRKADLEPGGLHIGEWEDEVVRGVGLLEDGSPSLQFRRQLQRRKSNNMKTSQRDALGLYAKAFRAWVRGEPVRMFKPAPDGVPLPPIEFPYRSATKGR